jgi:hypothetical protein
MYTIHIALVLLLLCLSSFAAGRFCSHREYSVSLSLKSWSNPHEMFHVLHALFSLFCLVKEILLFTPVLYGRLSDREQELSHFSFAASNVFYFWMWTTAMAYWFDVAKGDHRVWPAAKALNVLHVLFIIATLASVTISGKLDKEPPVWAVQVHGVFWLVLALVTLFVGWVVRWRVLQMGMDKQQQSSVFRLFSVCTVCLLVEAVSEIGWCVSPLIPLFVP